MAKAPASKKTAARSGKATRKNTVKPKATAKTSRSGPAKPATPAKPAAAAGALAVGRACPKFKLPASTGEVVDLAKHLGRAPVVIYFYPKADTPGCTVEACGFRDAIAGYRNLGVPVFGISPDPVKEVTAFAKKFDLTFPLLADADHAVCERFGVWVQKSMYGKSYMGAARTTFIVGRDGRIAHVFEKVRPEGHDQEVLAWLRDHAG